jgi:hypothetical protein
MPPFTGYIARMLVVSVVVNKRDGERLEVNPVEPSREFLNHLQCCASNRNMKARKDKLTLPLPVEYVRSLLRHFLYQNHHSLRCDGSKSTDQ